MKWTAPTPPWILRATDRRGKLLSTASRFLLIYLWSRADAPSKRKGPGPTFIRPCWRMTPADIAAELGMCQRTIEYQLAILVRSGLVRRGDHLVGTRLETGIWLADAEVARFEPQTIAVDADSPHENDCGRPRKRLRSAAKDFSSVTENDCGRIKEARSDPDLSRSLPDHLAKDDVGLDEVADPPTRTESPRPHLGRARMQQGLFEEPPEPPKPVRDPAMEVFEYLAERIYVTKVDLGLPARGLTTLARNDRKLIQAMIDEHSDVRDERGKKTGRIDVELGIAACRQVIEVDEADARRTKNFTYWNATTPFRPSNFDMRLGRWRPDGKHEVMFAVSEKSKPKDAGFNAYMPDEQREALMRKVSRGGRFGNDGHGGGT
jgi:hypothetical protein